MKVKQLNSITEIDSVSWNKLAGQDYPFLRHEFLLSLEQSESVSEKTGWLPQHLLVMDADELIALMPLYLKTHSRGEYVFDQQWAQAHQQAGFHYYPKWLTSIPFTPCQGPRFIIKDADNQTAITKLLLDTIKAISASRSISSWHCLFANPDQINLLQSLGLAVREDVQFHWFNKNYHNFDDFLQTLTSSKRKMIRRERRKILEHNIRFEKLLGTEVSEAQWQAFYQFYTITYLKNGSRPYLNLTFFLQCAALMGKQMLLIMAVKDHRYVGAALSFIGTDTLYGRYWGSMEEFDFLHFETCYYQGLEYAIERQLAHFDSGAQGEHKIARGFEPITTYSAHWIKNESFAKAIKLFLLREQKMVSAYKQDASTYLPFKKQ